jgi:hypothetical protein
MVARKDVGTEVAPSDASISNGLDCRPIFGADENLITQPVRNSLLAYADAFSVRRRVVRKELPHPLRELNLVAGNGNRSLQGRNVVLLHGTHITRNRVLVNKAVCLTDTKDSCTVLHMPTTKKKPHKQQGAVPRPVRKSEPIVGPDGFTMSQRVLQLMAEQGMSQTDLAKACSQYYAAFMPGELERVKQQHIFNIIQGQDSSWVVTLIAGVFDVNALWLQFGIGKREVRAN